MSERSGGSVEVAPARHTSSPQSWRTAVWVLAGAAAAAVLFVSGLVTGYVLGDRDAGTATQPAAGRAPGDGAPPAVAGEEAGPDTVPVDGCVVGSWVTVEHEETFTTEQGAVTIAGLVRRMDVGADGRQTVTYEDASATMSTAGASGTAVYDGTVVYRVSTSGGTMTFELVSAEGTITITPEQGEPRTEELRPGTGPVSYTCDGDRLVQEAEGFRAVYERSA